MSQSGGGFARGACADHSWVAIAGVNGSTNARCAAFWPRARPTPRKLPLMTTEVARPGAVLAAETSPTGVERVVAIIEDDADLRWLLEEFARERAASDSTMYTTYDEAFTGLLAHPVDAIIADCVGCGFLPRPARAIELGLLNWLPRRQPFRTPPRLGAQRGNLEARSRGGCSETAPTSMSYCGSSSASSADPDRGVA